MATTRSTGPVFSYFAEGILSWWTLEAFNPSTTRTRRVKFTVWNLSVSPATIVAQKTVNSLAPLGRVTLSIPFCLLAHTMAVEEDDGLPCQDPLFVTIYGQNNHGKNIAGAVYRDTGLITSCLKRVYWYRPVDYSHFTGGLSPVSPTAALTSFYDTTVNSTQILDTPPDNYDVLMIADVGANFDISAFTGRVILTFDSGISPLMYWFTGDLQYDVYWNYGTQSDLDWVTPDAPNEVGAAGDARIYPTLASAAGFVRRNDLMEAFSTTQDMTMSSSMRSQKAIAISTGCTSVRTLETTTSPTPPSGCRNSFDTLSSFSAASIQTFRHTRSCLNTPPSCSLPPSIITNKQ